MLKGSFRVSFLDILEMCANLPGLLTGFVILGRAPGFRKTEVKKAFQESLVVRGTV